VGKIAQLKVPRDREGTFLTEVFERDKRMTGEVEEAVLEMYLQGVSTRKTRRASPRGFPGSGSARTWFPGSPSV
jgi:putative transposase